MTSALHVELQRLMDLQRIIEERTAGLGEALQLLAPTARMASL
jgi:hypothetical protein